MADDILRFPTLTELKRIEADEAIAEAIGNLVIAHRTYRDIGDERSAARCLAALNGLEPRDV